MTQNRTVYFAAKMYEERIRQIKNEGFTQAHDDYEHNSGELAMAAAAYCLSDKITVTSRLFSMLWPWTNSWWKPRTRERDLIRAGALIIAELERLERAEEKVIDVK